MDKYYEQANIAFKLTKDAKYKKTKDRHEVIRNGFYSWRDVENALDRYNKVAVYKCGTLYCANFEVKEPCVEVEELENDSIFEEYRYKGFNRSKLKKGMAIKIESKDLKSGGIYLIMGVKDAEIHLINYRGNFKKFTAEDLYNFYEVEILGEQGE